MDACYANVGDEFDGVAHQVGGNDGFFGDGEIAGSGADDADDSLASWGGGLAEGDAAGGGVMLGAGNGGEDGGGHFVRGAGGENVATSLGHAGEYGCDLGGSFSGGEYDFRHAGAEGAVVVYFGEAEVLKGKVFEAGESFGDGGAAVADFVE